jgi:hypothetical protein
MGDVDEMSEMFAKTLAIDGNSRHGMSSSPSSVPSADVRDDDFVHIINENDTSENNDER